MANARLSERSVNRFNIFSGFMNKTLQTVHWVGAQSTGDAERLIKSGTNTYNTTVTGNLKFDLDVPASLEETAIALRSRWNPQRPVLVAGSTHEADEVVVLPHLLKY